MTKQKTEKIEILRKMSIELTIFPRTDCALPSIRLRPKKRKAALTPNNKKLTHGRFRVAGNLAKTRE
jgi:hypothetical protein